MFDSLFLNDYYLARIIFKRGLAAIYLISFLVAFNQFPALLGKNGLLPVPEFIQKISFKESPSIFYFYYSDTYFLALSFSGIIISLSALLGVFDNTSWYLCALIWGFLWLLYLSIVNVGQEFYGFGWESMLLEAGFLCIFLGSNRNAVPFILIILIRWMLFRLELGAGLIKIRGDQCWRDFTCLNYHHETQPMPNMLSWYFHNMPKWFHKFEVIGNHFFQIVIPWGLFLPQPIAGICSLLIILSQSWLILSGNYSWLNWLTIVLAVSGFSNIWFEKIRQVEIPSSLSLPISYRFLVLSVSALILYLSYYPVRNLFSRNQLMNASFNPFHLVNCYGAFGTVTKVRYEIVIEGTEEDQINEHTKWKEYQFKGKPGAVNSLPRQFAPYHLRLDWLMWFEAFNSQGRYSKWYMVLIEKLLQGDPKVLSLLSDNPFPNSTPKFIRAQYYRYRFTSPFERDLSGNWWKREFVREHLPAVSLN